MDIVRICGGDYTKYEALLLRRDSLKKEAMDYLSEYIRTFGELTMAVYEKQIECIKLKKSIAFCQTAANYGRKPDREQLEAFLQQEMAEYYQKLRQMADDNQTCKDAKAVPEHDVLRIKIIYHDIAKKLHPNISPLTEKYPELLELWYRLVTAYVPEADNIIFVRLLDAGKNARGLRQGLQKGQREFHENKYRNLSGGFLRSGVAGLQ